jgi:hypothetical protein
LRKNDNFFQSRFPETFPPSYHAARRRRYNPRHESYFKTVIRAAGFVRRLAWFAEKNTSPAGT